MLSDFEVDRKYQILVLRNFQDSSHSTSISDYTQITSHTQSLHVSKNFTKRAKKEEHRRRNKELASINYDFFFLQLNGHYKSLYCARDTHVKINISKNHYNLLNNNNFFVNSQLNLMTTCSLLRCHRPHTTHSRLNTVRSLNYSFISLYAEK